MTNALVLINPNSRNGRQDISAALDILRTAGLNLEIPQITDNNHFADVIREKGRDYDCIIVGGGDGTLNGAIAGMLKLDRPLGILPLGTANDLARTLTLPADLESCARHIAAGHIQKIDVGQVNDHYFFNVASVGISSDVARILDRDLKARYGVFGYVISLWRAVARRRVIRGEMTYDGKSLKSRLIQISVGNGIYYGGGMVIAADAQIDDGTLDVILVPPQSVWQLIGQLPVLRWGRHDLNRTIHHLRVREFSLKTRRPLPINTDGEVTTRTPATFKIVPGAIDVFVPGSPAHS